MKPIQDMNKGELEAAIAELANKPAEERTAHDFWRLASLRQALDQVTVLWPSS